MEEFISFKRYVRNAKSRMLKTSSLPPFIGKVPYSRYELLLKLAGDNELLCKMCEVIESGNELTPITYLIDTDRFNNMSVAERQRYVFRLAQIYQNVKSLYEEMNAPIKITC